MSIALTTKLKYPEYFLKEAEKSEANKDKESLSLLKQMQNLKLNKYAKYFKGNLKDKEVVREEKKIKPIPTGKERIIRNELGTIKKIHQQDENHKIKGLMYQDEDDECYEMGLDSSLVSYVKNGNCNGNVNGHVEYSNLQCNNNIQSIVNNNLEVIFEQETQRNYTLENTANKSEATELQYSNMNYKKTDNQIYENFSSSFISNSNLQNDPQYIVDYLMDIYFNLLDEEKEIRSLSGYMSTQTDINEKMRAVLIDWIIDVHYKFKLTPETLFLTVNLIDRYLYEKNLKRDKLQLVGVVALSIACKYEEIYSPELRDFEYITDKAYKKEEITSLEIDMLKLFNFEITVPSSFRFYEIICTKLNFDEKDFALGRYLLELFLLDYRYTKFTPGQIACSVCFLVISFKQEKEKDLNVKRNEDFSLNRTCRQLDKFLKFNINSEEGTQTGNYTKSNFNPHTNSLSYESSLKECCRDICFILENVDNTGLSSVKKKFLSAEFFKVAKLRVE